MFWLLPFYFSGALYADDLIFPNLDQVRGRSLPNIEVEDESGKQFSLWDLQNGTRALIVVPFYSRCKAACSPTTESLKTALAGSDLKESEYQVVNFSFDPEETKVSLANFRNHHHLPGPWRTVRARREAIDLMLTTMDFHVLTMPEKEYQHSNLIVITDPKFSLHGFLSSSWLKPIEVQTAVRSALAPKPSRFLGYDLLSLSLLGLLASAIGTVFGIRHVRRSKNK